MLGCNFDKNLRFFVQVRQADCLCFDYVLIHDGDCEDEACMIKTKILDGLLNFLDYKQSCSGGELVLRRTQHIREGIRDLVSLTKHLQCAFLKVSGLDHGTSCQELVEVG